MNESIVYTTLFTLLLPPATKLGQGNVFTGVCDSVNRGGLSQCMLGYHPPREQAPPPRSRHPPWEQAPPKKTDPPRSRPPPAQSMLGDTVNARTVRILLECNLVLFIGTTTVYETTKNFNCQYIHFVITASSVQTEMTCIE